MSELISIIVPVYNAEKFIKETIASVQAQDYQNWELLLVDDCSKDSSAKIISECDDARVKLVSQPENKGAYAARNRGLKEAKGRYIAFLDADDLWEPEKLSHQLAFMKEHNAGFSFTGYEFADENGVGNGSIVKVPLNLPYKRALHNTTIFTSTVMINRDIVADELIVMPDIRSEDTATWWNIMKGGHVACGLNENLVKYRRFSGTLSANKLVALKRIWDLLRKIAGLNVFAASWHFCLWAFLAVWRRVRKSKQS
ncbi:MAG: glycosyltransferase [Lachnospiraceae bacterium]|nr:glycosyltransferase [Lachnospiraceae bacterium]